MSTSVLYIILFIPNAIALLCSVVQASFSFRVNFYGVLSRGSRAGRLSSTGTYRSACRQQPANGQVPRCRYTCSFHSSYGGEGRNRRRPRVQKGLRQGVQGVSGPVGQVTRGFPRVPLNFSHEAFCVLGFRPLNVVSSPNGSSLKGPIMFASEGGKVCRYAIRRAMVPYPIYGLGIKGFPRGFVGRTYGGQASL